MPSKKVKMPCPLENVEQEWVFQWAAMQTCKHPELEWMYAVPNGGYRNTAEAAHMKRQGVKAGVPDIFLPAMRGGFGGLYIELKRAEKSQSSVSDNQREWLSHLERAGYKTAVCYGADDAIQTIQAYLALNTLSYADRGAAKEAEAGFLMPAG